MYLYIIIENYNLMKNVVRFCSISTLYYHTIRVKENLSAKYINFYNIV